MLDLEVVTDDYKLDKNVRDVIEEKIVRHLDKYMGDIDESLQKAVLRIQSQPRFGFKTSFDMGLPGKKHIYAVVDDENLIHAIVMLREEVEKQFLKIKETRF